MLRPFPHPVACCCAKFETGQTFQPTTPNIFLFHDRRSVAQQCWIRLHSSSNIVGAAHAHYAWFTKTYGLYPSHDALQVPTMLRVVASVCTPLPTQTQQLPTLLRHCCTHPKTKEMDLRFRDEQFINFVLFPAEENFDNSKPALPPLACVFDLEHFVMCTRVCDKKECAGIQNEMKLLFDKQCGGRGVGTFSFNHFNQQTEQRQTG